MIVLCVGVFDMFHVAHLRHLKEAATWGTLVVGVTADSHVNKPGRPIIPHRERLEIVKSLRCVSQAQVCLGSMDALREWEPDIFVKGDDYRKKGLLDEEIDFCRKHGIKVRFTKENPQTTTGIIQRCLKLSKKTIDKPS